MNAMARNSRNRSGLASIVAIILLAVLVALAAGLAGPSDLGLQKGRNLADAQRARLAAESGLAFIVPHLRNLALSWTTTDSTLSANVAAALAGRLNGTANLAGQVVQRAGDTVTVPIIQTNDGAFQVLLVKSGVNTLRLEVHGWRGDLRRIVALDLYLTAANPNSAFNYGIASRGAIAVSGNAQIRGKNQATDASVISTTAGPVAITIEGNTIIDGDVSSVGAATTVVISGSPTIAGSQNPVVIAQHIHFGVEAPVFPEVDTGVFRPLANGDVIDGSTDTTRHGAVFNNPTIKANTNPTFSSDVVLNGIVFVEAPNRVTFTAKVTLNGLVATEQASSPLADCRLSFAGQVEAFGVSALPSGPMFDQAKQMTGTFIVAPGFDVSFAGQFTAINGTIAAEKLTFSGQASGTVNGSVIGLGNYPTAISGTVDIYIDRKNDEGDDAGFHMPVSLGIRAETYRELSGT